MPGEGTSHAAQRTWFSLEKDLIVLCASVVLLLWFVFLISIARQSVPHFTNGTYSIDSGPARTFVFPLSFPSAGQNVVIDVDLTSLWGYRPLLYIAVDDCILSMTINGHSVASPVINLPYCNSEPKEFRLHDFLGQSVNHFSLTLRDHGGLTKLTIDIGKADPLKLLFWILGIASVLVYVAFCARVLRWHVSDMSVAAITCIGILLRYLYMASTSYDVRSHEWDKHVEYILHMARHFSVPPAAAGWEFHQPPFYYLLTGLWMRIGGALSRTMAMLLHDLQMISLLMSILTLLVGVGIAYTLFHGPMQRLQRMLMVALVATFPTLVMFSSRINNDTLLQFLAFLFVFFLVRFWQGQRLQDFWGQTFVIAVALLTKLSGLIFMPVSILCIACMRGMMWGKKILLVSLLIAFCLVTTGWLPILRYTVEHDTSRSLYFASKGIDPMVKLTNIPKNFLVFHPLEILRHPFNDPYSDQERRQFFPEYFFKSAFFGEFSFPDTFRTLSFLILGLGLVSLVLACAGVIQAVRTRQPAIFPLVLITVFHLAAALIYRYLAPFSPAQDFRYVTILTIPWFYFAILGSSNLPAPLRRFCTSILFAWALVCAIFFLKIFFD